MTIFIHDDYNAMSQATAELIEKYIKDKPDSMVCIASGSTPLGLCNELEQRVRDGKINFERTTFIALDEWVGMGPDDGGSCQNFLKNHLFHPLNISSSQVIQFDAKAIDLQSECDRINQVIRDHGGLDIIVVGIGLNGHIGLNEPGTAFDSFAHISILEEVTKSVGQKYFNELTPLNKGITLGLQHVADAKLPILIASGEIKKDIMAKALEGSVDIAVPGTIFQKLAHGIVILDADAAKLLTK